MTDLQQTREVTTAVQQARALRKRLQQAGAHVGEVQMLAALFDLHERIEVLEKRLPTQHGRAERDPHVDVANRGADR
jgi:hypothetical protein